MFSFEFLFTFCSGIIGYIISIILFVNKNDKTLANKLLAISIFSISLIVFSNSLYVTNFYINHPHLYRSFSWIGFCIGPVSYLYVRTVLNQAFLLKKRDLLFFIPAFLYMLHRIPFYILSETDKQSTITQNLINKKNILLEPEGWLPMGWAAIFRISIGVFFISLQLNVLFRWRKRIKNNVLERTQNKEMLSWITLFTFLILSTYLIVGLETLFHINGKWDMGTLIILNMSTTVLVICTSLFAKPNILYGISGWQVEEIRNSNDTPVGEEQTEVSTLASKQSISLSERIKYKHLIEQHFNTTKPFTAEGYSLNDLSGELGIPSYQLSAFINQEFEKNFNEFINDARIKHLIYLKDNDANFEQYTLEYIGKMIGFNSRTSFIHAVKKRTGKTPSQLLKESTELPNKRSV